MRRVNSTVTDLHFDVYPWSVSVNFSKHYRKNYRECSERDVSSHSTDNRKTNWLRLSRVKHFNGFINETLWCIRGTGSKGTTSNITPRRFARYSNENFRQTDLMDDPQLCARAYSSLIRFTSLSSLIDAFCQSTFDGVLMFEVVEDTSNHKGGRVIESIDTFPTRTRFCKYIPFKVYFL